MSSNQKLPALVGARLGPILAVHLPLTALGFVVAAHRPGASSVTLIAGGVFGFIFWTFFEYAFHRWFLHGAGPLRPMYVRFHLEHHAHAEMNDPNHRGLLLRLTLASVAFTYAWVGLASGATAFFVAAVAGYNLGYCAYEVLHWVHHATRWASRFGGWLAAKDALHVHHHFHGPGTNFGFLTSVWDRLLGTFAAPAPQPASSSKVHAGVYGDKLSRCARAVS